MEVVRLDENEQVVWRGTLRPAERDAVTGEWVQPYRGEWSEEQALRVGALPLDRVPHPDYDRAQERVVELDPMVVGSRAIQRWTIEPIPQAEREARELRAANARVVAGFDPANTDQAEMATVLKLLIDGR